MADRELCQVAAVIPAAGIGRRMGTCASKALFTLAGQSVLHLSLQAMVESGWLDVLVIVARAEEMDTISALLADWPPVPTAVVPGGAERSDSVRAGLEWLAVWPDWLHEARHFVAVHDAARPLLSRVLWERILGEALREGAAIPGLSPADTVKQVDGGGRVTATVSRENLMSVQTPQVFVFEKLLEAHRRAHQEGHQATDDAQVWEMSGWPVKVVPGERENLKVTTPFDLVLAEAILRQRGFAHESGPGL